MIDAGVSSDVAMKDESHAHWKDKPESIKQKLRPYYQKHLSNELSWQKNPKLYTSGKLPLDRQTYVKPGFHKNLKTWDMKFDHGVFTKDNFSYTNPKHRKQLLKQHEYLDINKKDIVPKTTRAFHDPDKYAKRFSKLKQRLGKVRTAKPIIQETGEGITFKKVDPKIYGKKTYGWHKVPMHPSNTILIRPKDPEHYMDLVKHFRKIHETPDFAKYTQGSVQQSIPLRSLKNNIKHMSGESLKHHADISSAKNKAFKRGDILMRRVGGTPEKGKYGTVGETFYIEEDSPAGETFNAASKYNRR